MVKFESGTFEFSTYLSDYPTSPNDLGYPIFLIFCFSYIRCIDRILFSRKFLWNNFRLKYILFLNNLFNKKLFWINNFIWMNNLFNKIFFQITIFHDVDFIADDWQSIQGLQRVGEKNNKLIFCNKWRNRINRIFY